MNVSASMWNGRWEVRKHPFDDGWKPSSKGETGSEGVRAGVGVVFVQAMILIFFLPSTVHVN